MAAAAELVEYLNQGPCLVVIGAGPSCELGLPDWKGLAEEILNEMRLKKPKNLELAEIDFAKENYTALFDRAWSVLGQSFVVDCCKKYLPDTGKPGKCYSLLTRLPFRGYLTTNIESLLKRHFDDIGVATTEFQNNKSSLEDIDFDTLKCIVKIHGSLGAPNTLVLTESQYEKVTFSPEFEPLRHFLLANLANTRVLFVGYSLRDADLRFLLQMATHKFRRKVPMYALLANATDYIEDEWDRKYNIRTVSYYSKGSRHEELAHLLEAISSYVALRGETVKASTLSLSVAQSLYMWHRFQSDSGKGARTDAFRSMILTVLNRKPETSMSTESISKSIATMASMDAHVIVDSVGTALKLSEESKLVQRDQDNNFRISQAGQEIEAKYSRQFLALEAEFWKQLEFDYKKLIPELSRPTLESIKVATIDAIMSTFAERGVELVQLTFGTKGDLRAGTNLFKIISAKAQSLPHPVRYKFAAYLTQILTKPEGSQEKFLEYLAKSFFAAQALGLDPNGDLARKQFFSNHTLLLDSNVLIPALTLRSSANHFIVETIKQIKKSGLMLAVTPRFLEETVFHFTWAIDLVRKYGEQSLEVYSAALGRGHYRRNECIDGFIRYCADVKQISFDEYVEKCFGGNPEFQVLRKKVEEIGITFLPLGKIAGVDTDFYVVRDQTEEYIVKAAQLYKDLQKNETRIRAESEVYSVLYCWNKIKPKDVQDEDWLCSFLSRAAFLNRVAWQGPHKLERNVTVRPDSVYEFLTKLEGSGTPEVPLKDILLATYFRSASHFIDKAKYSDFFSPLLRSAEELYGESFEQYRRLVNGGLTKDYLEEFDQLERPFVVAGLKAEADDSLREEANRLANENFELRKHQEKLEKELAALKAKPRKHRR